LQRYLGTCTGSYRESASRRQHDYSTFPFFFCVSLFSFFLLSPPLLTSFQEELTGFEIVGGATRIPKIQSVLKEYLGREELDKHVNGDEGAATGNKYNHC
jgi:hypothetical protein